MKTIRYPDVMDDALKHQTSHQVTSSTVSRHNDPVSSPSKLVTVLQHPDVGVEDLLHSPGVGRLWGEAVVNGEDGHVQLLAPLVQVVHVGEWRLGNESSPMHMEDDHVTWIVPHTPTRPAHWLVAGDDPGFDVVFSLFILYCWCWCSEFASFPAQNFSFNIGDGDLNIKL